MHVIRPVRNEDADQIGELARARTFGLTTLPDDLDLLKRRISASVGVFAKMNEAQRGATFFFVLEETRTHRVVGTTGIVSKVGGFEPFYAYRLETSVHHSECLGVHKEVPVLHLVAEHDGPCEIGSLYLARSERGHGLGRLLSLSRFLFMAQHKSLFDPVVIAELRGVIEKDGRAPFWEAVGRHFFDIDFPRADYLSLVNKRFIADLMPKHPIYVPLLPFEAQQVIGKEHERTRPARRLLESEGFTFANMVDIFEAGPAVSCPLDDVRTVRCRRSASVKDVVGGHISSPAYIIANTRHDFRACLGSVEELPGDQLRITKDTATALGIDLGEQVQYIAAKSADAPVVDHPAGQAAM